MQTIESPTQADRERIQEFGRELQAYLDRARPMIVSIEAKAFIHSIKVDVSFIALKCQSYEGT